MFCPQCRTEYRPEFYRCSDCNIELVQVLPEFQPIDPDRFVMVFLTHNWPEFELAKGFFPVHRIPFVTFGDAAIFSGMNLSPHGLSPPGQPMSYGRQLQIWVPNEYAEQARQALADAEKDNRES